MLALDSHNIFSLDSNRLTGRILIAENYQVFTHSINSLVETCHVKRFDERYSKFCQLRFFGEAFFKNISLLVHVCLNCQHYTQQCADSRRQTLFLWEERFFHTTKAGKSYNCFFWQWKNDLLMSIWRTKYQTKPFRFCFAEWKYTTMLQDFQSRTQISSKKKFWRIKYTKKISSQ